MLIIREVSDLMSKRLYEDTKRFLEAKDAEIARLTARLEVFREGDNSTDGIACRDETIKQQDIRIKRLTADVKFWRDNCEEHTAIRGQQTHDLEQLQARVDELEAAIRFALQRRGSKHPNIVSAMDRLGKALEGEVK